MKKKYLVTIYHETYTEYIVEAKDRDEAEDLCMQGEYDEIEDTTVKQSEVISAKEYTE
jgi:hypothetical protein